MPPEAEGHYSGPPNQNPCPGDWKVTEVNRVCQGRDI